MFSHIQWAKSVVLAHQCFDKNIFKTCGKIKIIFWKIKNKNNYIENYEYAKIYKNKDFSTPFKYILF